MMSDTSESLEKAGAATTEALSTAGSATLGGLSTAGTATVGGLRTAGNTLSAGIADVSLTDSGNSISSGLDDATGAVGSALGDASNRVNALTGGIDISGGMDISGSMEDASSRVDALSGGLGVDVESLSGTLSGSLNGMTPSTDSLPSFKTPEIPKMPNLPGMEEGFGGIFGCCSGGKKEDAEAEEDMIEVDEEAGDMRRGKELPDAPPPPLTLTLLDDFMVEVSNEFNQIFEASPPLPSPVPMGYYRYKRRNELTDDDVSFLEELVSCWRDIQISLIKGETEKETQDLKEAAIRKMEMEMVVVEELPYKFIDGEALRLEAEAAAPVFFLEPIVKNRSVRIISRLRLMYLKSREYAALNYFLYFQTSATFDMLRMSTVVLMSLSAFLLFFFGSNPNVVVFCAVCAIFVSTINSWIQFERYEIRVEGHKFSYTKFMKIANMISNRFGAASREMSERMARDVIGVDDKPEVFKLRSEFWLDLLQEAEAWWKKNILPLFVKFNPKDFALENMIAVRNQLIGDTEYDKDGKLISGTRPEYQNIIIAVANLACKAYVDNTIREDKLTDQEYLLNPDHDEAKVVRDMLGPKFVALLPANDIAHLKHAKFMLDDLKEAVQAPERILTYIARNPYAMNIFKKEVIRHIPQAMNKVMRAASRMTKNPRFLKVWTESSVHNRHTKFIEKAQDFNVEDTNAHWQAMSIAAAVRYSGVKDKLNETKYWGEINGYNPPRLEKIVKNLQEPLEIEKMISIDYNSNIDKRKKPLNNLETLCDASKSPDLFDHPLVVQLTRAYALFKALTFARLNADQVNPTNKNQEVAETIKAKSATFEKWVNKFVYSGEIVDHAGDIRDKIDDYGMPEKILVILIDFVCVTRLYTLFLAMAEEDSDWRRILWNDEQRRENVDNDFVDFIKDMQNEYRVFLWVIDPKGHIPALPDYDLLAKEEHIKEAIAHLFRPLRVLKRIWSPRHDADAEENEVGIEQVARSYTSEVGSLVDSVIKVEQQRDLNLHFFVDITIKLVNKAALETQLEYVVPKRQPKDMLHSMKMGLRDIEKLKRELKDVVYTVNDDGGRIAYRKLTTMIGVNPYTMSILNDPLRALEIIREVPHTDDPFNEDAELCALGVTNNEVMEDLSNAMEFLGVRQMLQQVLQYDEEILPDTVDKLKSADSFFKLITDKDLVKAPPEFKKVGPKKKTVKKMVSKMVKQQVTRQVTPNPISRSGSRKSNGEDSEVATPEKPKTQTRWFGGLLSKTPSPVKGRRGSVRASIKDAKGLVDPKRFEAELNDLYSTYNPEKVKDIPKIMKTFEGREDILLDELHKKYEVKDVHRRRLSVINRDKIDHAIDLDAFAAELESIYQQYNPEKIKDIPKIMKTFEGREDVLLDELHNKYAVQDAHRRRLSVVNRQAFSQVQEEMVEILEEVEEEVYEESHDAVVGIDELGELTKEVDTLKDKKKELDDKQFKLVQDIQNLQQELKVSKKKSHASETIRRKLKSAQDEKADVDANLALTKNRIREKARKKNEIRQGQHIFKNIKALLDVPTGLVEMMMQQKQGKLPVTPYSHVSGATAPISNKVKQYSECEDPLDLFTAVVDSINTGMIEKRHVVQLMTATITMLPPSSESLLRAYQELLTEENVEFILDEDTVKDPTATAIKLYRGIFEADERGEHIVSDSILEPLKSVMVDLPSQAKMILKLPSLFNEYFTTAQLKDPEHQIVGKINDVFKDKNLKEDQDIIIKKLKDLKIPTDILFAIGGDELVATFRRAADYSALFVKKDSESGDIMADPLGALMTFVGKGKSEKEEEDDGDGDDYGAVGKLEDSNMSVNEKLQVVLRYCAEYAVAHSLYAEYNRKLNEIQAFFTLLLAAVTSLIIFSGDSPTHRAAGGTFAGFTAFNELVHRLIDTAGAMHANNATSRRFNQLKQRILFLLLTSNQKTQEKNYQDIATQYYNIKQTAPFLPPPPTMDNFFKEKDLAGLSDDMKYLDDLLPMFIKKCIDDEAEDRRAKPYLELINKEDWNMMMYLDYLPGYLARFRSTIGIAFNIIDRLDIWWVRRGNTSLFVRQPPRDLEELDIAKALAKKKDEEVVNPMGVTVTDKNGDTDSESDRDSDMESDIDPEEMQDTMVEQPKAALSLAARRSSVARTAMNQDDITRASVSTLIALGNTEQTLEELEEEENRLLETLHLKKTIEQYQRNRMANMNMPELVAYLQAEFESAVAAMPSVPSLLPQGFIYIGTRDMLDEVKVIAPLKKPDRIPYGTLFDRPEFQRTTTERQSAALYRLYTKCMEYRTIHKNIAYDLNSKLLFFNTLALLISLLVTVTLLGANESTGAVAFGGVGAAVVSAIVSWMKFADYEATAANHKTAFARFANLASDIEAVFVTLRQWTEEYDPGSVLETLDEVMYDFEAVDGDDGDSDDESEGGDDAGVGAGDDGKDDGADGGTNVEGGQEEEEEDDVGDFVDALDATGDEDLDDDDSDTASVSSTSSKSSRDSSLSKYLMDRDSEDDSGTANKVNSKDRRVKRMVKRLKTPFTKMKQVYNKLKTKFDKAAEALEEDMQESSNSIKSTKSTGSSSGVTVKQSASTKLFGSLPSSASDSDLSQDADEAGEEEEEEEEEEN